MNNNTARIGLAVIAAFYAVVGGLWAFNYFPLQNFYAQIERKDTMVSELGLGTAANSEEYKAASASQERYVLTHPSPIVTEQRLAFYGSLLIWGTVAAGAAGGVLHLTRRRSAPVAKGNAQ